MTRLISFCVNPIVAAKNAVKAPTYVTISKDIHSTPVTIIIEKDGYETLTYTTYITPEGALAEAPPPLEKIPEEKGMMMVGVLLIIFMVIIMFCVLIFLKKVDEEYYPEE